MPAALWCAAGAMALAALRIASPSPVGRATAPSIAAAPAPAVHADAESLQTQAADLRAGNPFRLQRTPTDRLYGTPQGVETSQAANGAPEPSLPALTLAGIVGGPPWSAVLESGQSERPGMLLRVGEEWNGIRVEWIRSDSVKLVTADTGWIVALKRPWR